MFKKICILIFVFTLSIESFATVAGARDAYRSRSRREAKYKKIVLELVESGLYFTAIPWMKEYLIMNNRALSSDVESAFERILKHTGVKQFEILGTKYLKNSRSSSIKYILGKKYFKRGQYEKSLYNLRNVDTSHPIYPFALHLMGTLYSVTKKQKTAIEYFERCRDNSNQWLKSAKNKTEKKQLILNRDYCILGVARAYYSARDYVTADLKYLDIPKSSLIWPEILFEEAWNSYYKRDYNRTLGKLVTYNAPIFNYYFNPEVEVLKAMSYLKLCLYKDARKTANDYVSKYEVPYTKFSKFLKSRRKNYSYFYNMMIKFENSKNTKGFIGNILNSITRDGAYMEIKQSLIAATKEYEALNMKGRDRFIQSLAKNLKNVISTQKNILGAYVKRRMVQKQIEMYKALEGLTYIKLEILKQRKRRLYSDQINDNGKRGDEKYLDRNEKQYFWTFNGEFWADELGDYVFALGSKC